MIERMGMHASEFAVDRQAVRRAAGRRLFIRIVVVAALLALYGAVVHAWVGAEHQSLAWSFAFTVAAVYAAVEVSALGWSRRSAPTMRLCLTEQGLELWIGTGHHLLPWQELRMVRVRNRKGRAQIVELESQVSGAIRLAGFERMDELAQALTAQLAAHRADRA